MTARWQDEFFVPSSFLVVRAHVQQSVFTSALSDDSDISCELNRCNVSFFLLFQGDRERDLEYDLNLESVRLRNVRVELLLRELLIAQVCKKSPRKLDTIADKICETLQIFSHEFHVFADHTCKLLRPLDSESQNARMMNRIELPSHAEKFLARRPRAVKVLDDCTTGTHTARAIHHNFTD